MSSAVMAAYFRFYRFIEDMYKGESSFLQQTSSFYLRDGEPSQGANARVHVLPTHPYVLQVYAARTRLVCSLMRQQSAGKASLPNKLTIL